MTEMGPCPYPICRYGGTFVGFGRVQLKCDSTRWRLGGEVKGKLANGVGSQYPSHYLGTRCIQHYYRWWRTPRLPVVDWTDGHCRFNTLSAKLNPICHLLALLRAHLILHVSRIRVKWTRPFRRKTKSGFCACAITFQTQPTCCNIEDCTHDHRLQHQTSYIAHGEGIYKPDEGHVANVR